MTPIQQTVIQTFGAQYARRVAAMLAEVQPIHWPLLDTVLLDWWYESVIEPARATNDGMPGSLE